MQVEQSDTVEISPRQRLLVCLLALILYFPALDWPFFADDYVHLGILQGELEHPTLTAWSLFDFGTYQLVEGRSDAMGTFPWWTDPDWKARFFRPISSLSLWLDFQIYGARPFGFHLTNLLLFLLLVYLLYPLYRCWGLSPGSAFWSILVFVCLDDLVTPVSWPANRNAILASLFLVATILALQKARDGKSRWLLGAFLASSGAVLSKESGLVGFVMIAAGLVWHSYDFQKNMRPALTYRFSLTFSLVIPAGYLSALLWAGYGTRSLFYATPWDAPERFLEHLGILYATLATNLTMPFSLDALHFFPEHFYWLFWMGTIPGLILMIPVLRRLSNDFSPIVPGLLWMLICLLPQATAPVSDRLFFLPFIGGATLLGTFLSRERAASRKGFRQLLFVTVLLLCVPISAAATLLQGTALRSMVTLNRNSVLAMESLLEPGEEEVFVLQSPYSIAGFSAAWTYYGVTGDLSRRFRPMQIGRRALTWTRLDQNTFTLESEADLLTGPFERLFRTKTTRPDPGLVYYSESMRVDVLQNGLTGVRKIQIRLADSLDSERFVFLKAAGDGWARTDPPAIGQTVELPQPEVSNPLVP